MKIVEQFARLIKWILEFMIKPLLNEGFKFYYRKLDYPRPLPKCNNDLLLEPAHKLARKIRNKEISCLELIELYIERIRQVQPLIKCVADECFDEAIEEAKKVDEILSSETLPEKYSEENAPLLGVPFTVKESIWVKGKSNSAGITARKDFRPPEDAVVVKNMREAGAILLCLTNTSEGCIWLESSNYLFGRSCNPYNLSRIVGGSTGGEGAILAAAGSVVGIGSDVGGSIRIPACFTGIYGHKPTPHLVSNDYKFPDSKGMQLDMVAVGPMCRYASDLNLLMKVFLGPKYSEVSSKFESNIDLKKLKYFCVRDLQGSKLVSNQTNEIKNALEKTIKFIETNLEVEVKEIRLRKFKQSFGIWSALMSNGESSTRNYSNVLTNGKGDLNPIVELIRWALGLQANHTLPAIVLAINERIPSMGRQRYVKLCESLKAELNEILGDDSIMLFPSFPTPAPYHNQPLLCNTFDFVYFAILNALELPATQCPMGLSPEGLPIGIQVAANRGNDHLTIKLAEYLEANMVGWVAPF